MGEEKRMLDHLRNRDDDAPSEASEARREVAGALRALVHAIGTSAASPEALREVARALRAQQPALDAALGTRPEAETPSVLIPGMQDFHDRSPIAGLANPLAPPAVLGVDREAAIVVGEVTFGPAFEGAPGIAHGGFVSALLDEALGMASALCGQACMTAELTTRYRRHTPIGVPLRVEARLDSVDGRKVRTSGEILDGDTLIAEALGLFVTVGAEKFQTLFEDREAGRGAQSRQGA